MPYTWVNKPPIVETRDGDELKLLCTQFRAEVGKLVRPSTYKAFVWDELRFWAEREADKIQDAAGDLGVDDHYTYCVYKPLGKPVGLMECWKGPGQYVVTHFAMLPGHADEGKILVEHAVNLSEKTGYEGRVFFSAFNSAGHHKLPWLQSDDLIPSESNDWVKVGDKWRLQEHLLHHWRQFIIGREVFGKIHPQLSSTLYG